MRIRTQEALLLYLDPDLKICPNLEPRLQYEILKTVKNTSRFVLKNYSLTKIFRQTKKKWDVKKALNKDGECLSVSSLFSIFSCEDPDSNF